MSLTPWQRYQNDVQRPDFLADSAQENAVALLQDLYERLLAREQTEASIAGRLMRWWRHEQEPEMGLYFWGGDGPRENVPSRYVF